MYNEQWWKTAIELLKCVGGQIFDSHLNRKWYVICWMGGHQTKYYCRKSISISNDKYNDYSGLTIVVDVYRATMSCPLKHGFIYVLKIFPIGYVSSICWILALGHSENRYESCWRWCIKWNECDLIHEFWVESKSVLLTANTISLEILRNRNWSTPLAFNYLTDRIRLRYCNSIIQSYSVILENCLSAQVKYMHLDDTIKEILLQYYFHSFIQYCFTNQLRIAIDTIQADIITNNIRCNRSHSITKCIHKLRCTHENACFIFRRA